MGPAIGAAVGAAGQIIGGISSFFSKKRGINEARKFLQKNRELLEALPPLQKEALYMELDRIAPPEAWQPVKADIERVRESQLMGYQQDLQYEQAGRDALSGLGEYASGQVTDADMAALRDISMATGRDAAARQGALQQQAAAQGVAGSGIAQVRQAMAQQEAANRAAQSGNALQQSIQQRALQALMQQGSLAGQLEGQRFQQAESQASASDAIANFNAASSNQEAMRYAGAQDQSARDAVQTEMQANIFNANQGNAEEQARVAAEAAEYDDSRWRYGQEAGFNDQAAGYAQAVAQNASDLATGLGSAAGSLGGMSPQLGGLFGGSAAPAAKQVAALPDADFDLGSPGGSFNLSNFNLKG